MESIPWYLRLKTTFAEVVFGKKNYTNILQYYRTLFRSTNHHIPGLKICVAMIHCCKNTKQPVLQGRSQLNIKTGFILQPAHTSLIVPAGRLVQRLTCENVLGRTRRQTKTRPYQEADQTVHLVQSSTVLNSVPPVQYLFVMMHNIAKETNTFVYSKE